MSPLFGGGGGGDRSRSGDDRERARQEREERRAAREGRAPRALPPLPADRDAEPVAPEAVAYEPEPVAHEPEPLAHEPEPVLHEPEPVVHEPEPENHDPEPTVHEPESDAYEPEPTVHEPEPAAYEPDPAVHEPEPGAYEPDPIVHEPEPGAYEPEPIVHEPEPGAYEPEPVVHEAEPASVSADEAPPVGAGSASAESTSASAVEAPPAGAGSAFDEPSDTSEHDAMPPAVVVRGRVDGPVGVKRVAASSMASSAGADGPPRFGAPPRGVPKRRRGARRVIPLLFLAVVVAVAVFLVRLYQPGAGSGEGRVAVRIPEGASARQIGDLLAKREVVSSGLLFSLRARASGDNLRSGEITLKRGMSYASALAELSKAPPPAQVLVKVTLPEGPARKELAARVKESGITGSYVAATRRSAALDPRDYGAPRGASLEGFLFPATYELKPRSSARALVTQQVRTFRREFGQIDLATAKRAELTRYDVLIIASMIEREALVPKDRRLISGVIYNRLKQGMPLGIDATIRYELENFSQPLKVSELERDTPYNTRTRTGLPPGPIGNPGLAALEAAANPARNDFVYYVVKPCENGAHAFSETDAEFQRDVAAYNAKREELGGKDPSQC